MTARQMSGGFFNGKSKSEGPAFHIRCHREERSDAAISWHGVRTRTRFQETGKQAILINEIVEYFEKLPQIELKEFVGHMPLQVAAGVILGILDALFMYFVVFA